MLMINKYVLSTQYIIELSANIKKVLKKVRTWLRIYISVVQLESRKLERG